MAATGYHAPLLYWAERTPDRIAVAHQTTELSYGQLAQNAGKIAAWLRANVRGEAARVALLIDGHESYLEVYYGILMAGAVAVPVCPDLKGAALAGLLRHSGARAVFAGGRQVAAVQALRGELRELEHVIGVGLPVERLHAAGAIDLHDLVASNDAYFDDAGGDSLAAIHYTSGTTGAPKGVMLTHRNLSTNAQSIVEYLRLSQSDRAAMVLPFYYVYGSSVLHTHIRVGAEIRLLGSMAFVANVVKGIEEHQCTGLSGVPSTFAKLLNYSRLSNADLRSLRYVTQAGSAMKPSTCERLRRAVPSAEIFVMYGQTEASARLTYLPPKDLDRKAGSVGIAIPGVEITVRRPDGSQAEVDEVGEVCAVGENVAVGYLDAPELTARVFSDSGLHTGDLGYKDVDGYLYLVGRESDMIKSGGHRISPEEIEELIEELDAVREAAVIGVPDEELGEAIVAFVVQWEGKSVTAQEVMRACFSALPRFKLPREIHFVSDMLRTMSGKSRRRALRDAYIERVGHHME